MSQSSHAYVPQADTIQQQQQNLILGIEVLIATMTAAAITMSIVCLLKKCRGGPEIVVVHNEAPAAQPVQKHLTNEELDEFIPKLHYRKSENKFQSNTCAICLEDFSINYMIRKIVICDHIFHAACIEAWLKRHQNCPDCRQELSRAEFEKFKKNGGVVKDKKDDAPDIQNVANQSKPGSDRENQQQSQQNCERESEHPQLLIQIT